MTGLQHGRSTTRQIGAAKTLTAPNGPPLQVQSAKSGDLENLPLICIIVGTSDLAPPPARTWQSIAAVTYLHLQG
ncbi:hypothetical protein GGTG_10531 [Gaeumannomyces tritici R3-111a-1]|uniref:Uncharacterized protein n=1 Tax=Gaeumannomyces tritici (strain R3-111a-1) TaxID=644352 RepID=J3PAK6_GAET3|nr:hypothetical protein GGTG_10531 [Gaeumannomyces tritici R3-111a-1]EJT71272.1 hypothetical protein GGTG_10531 [Gaeumannomyces tritici R3-111a-1]